MPSTVAAHDAEANDAMRKLARKRTGALEYILNLTGMIYQYKEHEGFVRTLRKARAAFLVIIVTLHLVYGTSYVFLYGGGTLERSVVILCWLFQSLCSMLFILYWQVRGDIAMLIFILPWADLPAAYRKRLLMTVVLYGCLLAVILANTVLLIIFSALNPGQTLINPKTITPFTGWPRFLSYVVIVYSFATWAAVLTMYSVVLSTITEEIDAIKSEIDKIGHHTTDRSKSIEDLLNLSDRHAHLCKILNETNRIFEIYNFVMIGTNIPTTIFTMLNGHHSLYSGDTMRIMSSALELTFCIVEMTALTMMPAKVSSQLSHLEQAIFNNRQLWRPYDVSIYTIVQSLLQQNRQSGLGITVWGFAIVSKSLVLTTISLVLTYLTLLIQLTESADQSGDIFKQFWNNSLYEHDD
ncbi:unnamed protein product [Bursaphelenchus xylophilus]|uniref:(pine wood nematode) hypothetical protein n=1 Tax=Bursaphelenchus xylophilus TaxID=6326 RepID=A0A1I7SCI6_BURXY|nr:unnamed protein product [Bursaphelenchus xylophilus]CAG9094036.1 unnamed protein product [Bursaphelenchus xylophilus]